MDYLGVAFSAALLELIIHTSAIVILRTPDLKEYHFYSNDATFGPSLPEFHGKRGRIFHVNPIYACGKVQPVPASNETEGWIALISRGNNCTFVKKILNVQEAHFVGAIVYNVGSDEVIPMAGGEGERDVHIPSVFIGERNAQVIMHYNASHNATVELLHSIDAGVAVYFLIPFVIVIGLCVLALSTFLVIRCAVEYHRKLKTRLPIKKLKRLPIKKFKKGTELDVCAVCLDEYEDGDKLRVLPCGHEYHQKCIDPWLTKNRRTCPLCKRKVFPSDDSDSEAESNQNSGRGQVMTSGENSTERTPLLQTGRSHGNRRSAGRLHAQLPERRPTTGSRHNADSSDSDESEALISSQHQSSVEVHPFPRELLIEVDNAHSINVDPASISPDSAVRRFTPSSHAAFDNQAEGAVGGAPAEDMFAAVVADAKKKREKKKVQKLRNQDLFQSAAENNGLNIDDDHFSSDAVVPMFGAAATATDADDANVAGSDKDGKESKAEKSRHGRKKNKDKMKKRAGSAEDSVSVEVREPQQRREHDDDENGNDNLDRIVSNSNAALV